MRPGFRGRIGSGFPGLGVLLAAGLLLAGSGPAGSQEGSQCEYRYLGPGIQRLQLHDPEGAWSAEGIEVQLTDPMVNIETTIARSSVLGRETIGQIALRKEEAKRRLVAAVGCDFPDHEGLPRGFLVNNSELLSVPGGTSSFLITRSGKQGIGVLDWAMEIELSGGERLPIQRFNRPPGPGETALFTDQYGVRTGTPDGRTDVELDLFDAYLNPTGETRVKVGRVFPGVSDQVIPRFGFILSVPDDVYAQHASGLGYGIRGKLRAVLTPSDLSEEMRSELVSPEGEPTWPSRIGWAVSAGPRILRSGRISLEAEREGTPPAEVGIGNAQSALGIDPSRGVLWVVVVKAAAAPRVGLLEAARCLVLLGATEGMALAGGDRSPLRIRGEVINPPVSSKLEVPIADALLVYSKSLEPGLAGLRVEPGGRVYVPVGGRIDFNITAYDWSGDEVRLTDDALQIEHSSDLGRMEGKTFFAGSREGSTELVFRVAVAFGGGFADASFLATVSVRRPERLAISPSPAFLDPGERLDLAVELQDALGNALHFPREKVAWDLRGRVGILSPQGSLIASATGQGRVTAKYRRWRGEVPVYVGLLRTVEMDDMHAASAWGTRIQPMRGAECELEPLQGMVGGEHAGILHYVLPNIDGGQVVVRRRLEVEGRPYGFRLRVHGDGSGHRLRCLVEDRLGRRFQIGFREPITWRGEWRELDAPLELAKPTEGSARYRLRLPVTFIGLALVRGTDAAGLSGSLGIGRLEALYLDAE